MPMYSASAVCLEIFSSSMVSQASSDVLLASATTQFTSAKPGLVT